MALGLRRNRRFLVDGGMVCYRKLGGMMRHRAPSSPQQLINLGIKGLQFVAGERIRPGTRLELSLIGNRRFKTFEVEGEVIWGEQVLGQGIYRIGVTFPKLDPESKKKIEVLEAQFLNLPDDRKLSLILDLNQRFPIRQTEGTSESQQLEDFGVKLGMKEVKKTGKLSGDTASGDAEVNDPPAPSLPGFEPTPVPKPLEYPQVSLEKKPEQTAEEEEPGDSTPVPEPDCFPFFLAGEGRSLECNEVGYPVVPPRGFLACTLVQDANAFGIRWMDSSMGSAGPALESSGPVFIVSPCAEVLERDLVYCCAPNKRALIRRAYFEDDQMVRLAPLNTDFAGERFKRGDLACLWKVVARFTLY